MSDQYIVEHCSPTLAGLKTANLFSVKTDGTRDIEDEIRKLNKILTKKGLRAIPVRKTETYTLIYLYRPDYLERDLNQPTSKEILKKMGYPCDNTPCCIIHLCESFLQDDGSFPHEIGLFLGYPPSDVKGFMEHKDEGVREVGYWKVYSNVSKARRTFRQYKRCTEDYVRRVRSGKTLDQLIV